MANVLLDLGNEDGLSFYAGPGLGFAWGKFDVDGISDDSLIDDDFKDGGVRLAARCRRPLCLEPNVDLGAEVSLLPSQPRDGRFCTDARWADVFRLGAISTRTRCWRR